MSADAANQAGSGYVDSNGDFHALLWSGSADSAIDLNPTGLLGNGTDALSGQSSLSEAYGVSGNQEVGQGYGSNNNFLGHAILWTGSAASAVDLNPAGFSSSTAYGTDGTHQVGWGKGDASNNDTHALLWSGTAASAIDLNPTALGYTFSEAAGVGGNQEVGYGELGSVYTALLWTGTAQSAVPLSATQLGAYESIALYTNGLQQVGLGMWPVGVNHAVVWSGTTSSAVDLQLLLPADGTWTSSVAYTIDANGDIFGVANGTEDGFDGLFAVEWTPVPEPAGLCIFYLLSTALSVRRKRVLIVKVI